MNSSQGTTFKKNAVLTLFLIACVFQFGCAKPKSPYTHGLELTNKMRELTKAGNINEAAALVAQVEALPKEAMVQPDKEAPQVLDEETEDMVPKPAHLSSALDSAAQALDEQHQYALSERLLLKALSAEGRPIDLLRHVETVYAAQGKTREKEAIQREIALIESSRNVIFNAQPLLRQTHYQVMTAIATRGEVCLTKKEYKEAEQSFRLVSQGLVGDSGRAFNSRLPEAFRGLGKAQYLQGKYVEACLAFEKDLNLLKQAPADWRTNPYIRLDLSDYAKVLRKVSRTEEAEAVESDMKALPPVPDMARYVKDHRFDLD